jgi:hypothetical protein
LSNNNNDENDNETSLKGGQKELMAEVTLFQDEPSLPLQDDDGKFCVHYSGGRTIKKV